MDIKALINTLSNFEARLAVLEADKELRDKLKNEIAQANSQIIEMTPEIEKSFEYSIKSSIK